MAVVRSSSGGGGDGGDGGGGGLVGFQGESERGRRRPREVWLSKEV